METRIADLERRFDGEADAPRRRTNTGSTRSNTTESADQQQSWKPRLIHIRGWAPFGSPASSQISRAEAAAFQSDILAALDPEERATSKFLAPSMHIHMISTEVRPATYDAVKDAADSIKCAITNARITVRGSMPEAGIETSPSRRESLKAWFASKDALTRLNPEVTFAWCERGREAWTENGSYKHGHADKNSKQWIWLVENCRLADIKIPINMAADDDPRNPGEPREPDKPHDNEQEDDEEMDVPPAQSEAGLVRGAETQLPAGSAKNIPRVLRSSASAPPTPGPAAGQAAPEAQQGAAQSSSS